MEIKAFYMRVNDDDATVAAMDVLVPGVGEIIGGSQREERLDVLDARMAEQGVGQELWWYRDLRRYGTAPHAGFGLGLERLVLYMTGMDNIRDAIPSDAIIVSEGASTMDIGRQVLPNYLPRHRLDAGTFGTMGVGLPYAIAAAVVHPEKRIVCIEGDSAFGFSGMEVEVACRYNLPICVVVFNNNGIYRGTDVNPTGGSDAATTVFVKNSRYDKMMEAFGGVGVYATTPDDLSRAVNEAMDSGKPTLINAVIDEKAGTESGRIGNLNPQSVVSKK